MRLSTMMSTVGVLLAVGSGCASERATNPPASYQELKQQELTSERREYIDETKQRLDEIENDIGHLQARLDHEKQYVDAEQQAAWSQSVFELRQEQSRLQGQLERANSATPEEWEQMRGTLGNATDSLQAAVRKLQDEITAALSSDEAPEHASGGSEPSQSGAADSGLCRMGVSGAAAEVKRQNDRVTVTVTTGDSPSIPELQRRANELAKSTDSYGDTRSAGGTEQSRKNDTGKNEASSKPASDEEPSTEGNAPRTASNSGEEKGTDAIDVNVTAEKLADGAKLTFKPKNGDIEMLLERLERDAQRLGEGRCQARTKVSMGAK